MFKYAIKTEITRKYYERRLKKFFDFIEFEDIMKKILNLDAINLQKKPKIMLNWTLFYNIIRFLQYQKERVNKKEITAGTLKNFVKSLKVFCESFLIFLSPGKRLLEDYQMQDSQQMIEPPTIDEIRKLLEYP